MWEPVPLCSFCGANDWRKHSFAPRFVEGWREQGNGVAFATERHSLPVGRVGSLQLIHQAVLSSGWGIDSIKLTQKELMTGSQGDSVVWFLRSLIWNWHASCLLCSGIFEKTIIFVYHHTSGMQRYIYADIKTAFCVSQGVLNTLH